MLIHRDCGGEVIAPRMFRTEKWRFGCYRCLKCGKEWSSKSDLEKDLEPAKEVEPPFARLQKMFRLLSSEPKSPEKTSAEPESREPCSSPEEVSVALLGGYLLMQLLDAAQIISDEQLWSLNCKWVDANIELYMQSTADESKAVEHFLRALEGVDLPVLKKLEDLGRRFNAEGN